ncbi:MAG: YciI family protein [Acidobacteria bacterium]|nr:YciI family protein [Acidobacteriota bacterium]
MKSGKILWLTFCLMAMAPVAQAQTTAQTADPQAQTLKQFYNFNKRVIIASAEKMPVEHYSFKPTPEVRSYAELVGHVADGNYLTCAPVKGEPNPQKEIQHTEKTAKTKDEVIKALKASFDYCDAVFNHLTDATLKENYKQGERERPKASMATLNVYHGGEHYGNIVVYLRLKGLVPPSSEPAPPPQAQPKAESKPPQFDNETYQFGLLTRGPKSGGGDASEVQKLQAGHLAHIGKMAQAGKLFAAGPILDSGDLRGIFIFRAASADEVKTLAADDPMIKAERLKLEILPWFGSKGIGVKAMEEHKKNPDMKWTMKKHHLVLLRRGAQAGQPASEAQKLQLDHLWHIRRMMDEGKMLAAGPFLNNGELRGIFVFNTESAEEAKAWAEADPMVKAGWLKVEIHPWLVAKEVWP